MSNRNAEIPTILELGGAILFIISCVMFYVGPDNEYFFSSLQQTNHFYPLALFIAIVGVCMMLGAGEINNCYRQIDESQIEASKNVHKLILLEGVEKRHKKLLLRLRKG